MVGTMANMYLRHFTEAELKEIAAFQQTAVYRKQMGVIATLMSEAGTEVQNIIIARRPAIEAKVKARLGIPAKAP